MTEAEIQGAVVEATGGDVDVVLGIGGGARADAAVRAQEPFCGVVSSGRTESLGVAFGASGGRS